MFSRNVNESCISWIRRQNILVGWYAFETYIYSILFNGCKCGTCNETVEFLKNHFVDSYDRFIELLTIKVHWIRVEHISILLNIIDGPILGNYAFKCMQELFANEICRTDIAHMILPRIIMYIDACNVYQRTNLDYMIRNNRQEEAHLLIQYGAKLSNVTLTSTMLSIPRWAVGFANKRKAYKAASWAILKLRKQRAKVIGQNGRDVLGLIAKMIWRDRFIYEKKNNKKYQKIKH